MGSDGEGPRFVTIKCTSRQRDAAQAAIRVPFASTRIVSNKASRPHI
jgi:hypothetical protein